MARAVNNHHLWWPRAWYKTPLEIKFRNLPCNIVSMQVAVRQMLHECSAPPTKPLQSDMVKAIRNHEAGRCPCGTVVNLNDYRERRNRERRTPIGEVPEM